MAALQRVRSFAWQKSTLASIRLTLKFTGRRSRSLQQLVWLSCGLGPIGEQESRMARKLKGMSADKVMAARFDVQRLLSESESAVLPFG